MAEPPQCLLLRPLREEEGRRYATALRDAGRNIIPYATKEPFGILMRPIDWASLEIGASLYDAVICAFAQHLHRISSGLLFWTRSVTK